jgi:hypothetical protein
MFWKADGLITVSELNNKHYLKVLHSALPYELTLRSRREREREREERTWVVV